MIEENIIKDNRRKWVSSGLPFHGDYEMKISHPVKKNYTLDTIEFKVNPKKKISYHIQYD